LVGRKLHQLIIDLNTSERKLFIYKAKKSGDKRYKHFATLLGVKNQSIADFQKNLTEVQQQITSQHKSLAEKNITLRRFIDFCIKEIENIKIENYAQSNPVIKNYILSNAYNKIKTKEIYEDYLDKLGTATKGVDDYWFKSYYLNKASVLKLVSQTDKGFNEWRTVISEQINLLQDFHQKELTNIYQKISSSYVDDKNSIQYFDMKYLTEEYIFKQIDLISNPKLKATFYLVLARFKIEDEHLYPIYSSQSLKLIKGIEDEEANLIRRRVYFASFLHTFHFNYPNVEIKKLLIKSIEIDALEQLEDPKLFFYLFLIQILKNDKSGSLNYYTSNYSKYFVDESVIYLSNFLKALEFYKDKNYKDSKRILSDLSFVNNPYVASWSRCMEIAASYNKGDKDLAENLIQKEIKRLQNLTNRIFTINSSVVFIVELSKKLNIKTPKKLQEICKHTSKLSPFHQFLIDSLSI
jgi:hypothetical protein